MDTDYAYDVPEGFTHWHRYKRLEWHRNRIRREEKAIVMLGIDLSMTDDEVIMELVKVREERERVEGLVKALTDSYFMCLRDTRDEFIFEAKFTASERIKIILGPSEEDTQDKLKALREAEDVAISKAETIEMAMGKWAVSLGFDPEPFMRVRTLEWRQ